MTTGLLLLCVQARAETTQEGYVVQMPDGQIVGVPFEDLKPHSKTLGLPYGARIIGDYSVTLYSTFEDPLERQFRARLLRNGRIVDLQARLSETLDQRPFIGFAVWYNDGDGRMVVYAGKTPAGHEVGALPNGMITAWDPPPEWYRIEAIVRFVDWLTGGMPLPG